MHRLILHNMPMRIIVTAIIMFSLIGIQCFALMSKDNELQINPQEKAEVRKVIFESLFRESAKDLSKTTKIYCLSIESSKDPDDDFIQSLSVEGVRFAVILLARLMLLRSLSKRELLLRKKPASVPLVS